MPKWADQVCFEETWGYKACMGMGTMDPIIIMHHQDVKEALQCISGWLSILTGNRNGLLCI
jgi:hypothetical protein